MTKRPSCWLGAATLVTVLVAATATAAPPAAKKAPTDAVARAKAENARARTLFNLGRFRQAAEAYTRAYEAKAAPAFLYNLAQCYRRLDRLADQRRALFYYDGYLAAAPLVAGIIRTQIEKERAEVRRHIARLTKKPTRRPIYKKWWFWTTVGAVIAAGAVATGVAMAARDKDPIAGTAAPGVFSLP